MTPGSAQLFINGAWTLSEADQSLDVSEAATGETLATIQLASAADADAACEAAYEAFPAWSALSPFERAVYLGRIADHLEAHAAEIAQTIAREVGMPLKLAERIQVAAPIAAWRNHVRLVDEFPWREQIGHSAVDRVPAGVAACITPWNYPLHQITAKVAPALLAGCTVVLKPAETAPLSAFALAEAVEAAGLPEGVFNLVVGTGREAGTALIENERVDVISFTGSTAVGRHIAESAGRGLKRVSLELGGKSASILLPGGDVAAAAKSTLASCMLNSGQTCSALTRLLVPGDLQQEAVDLVAGSIDRFKLGDPLDPETRLGPLVSEAQQRRVLDYIDAGLQAGAKLVAGGPGIPEDRNRGFFVRPTVFADVMPDMTIAREEIFGPVLCIMPYGTTSEAVEIANGTPYGLAAAVWGATSEEAASVGRQLRAGQVDINGAPFNLKAPFGGFGASGIGRENGRFGLDEFLEYRSLQIPASDAA